MDGKDIAEISYKNGYEDCRRKCFDIIENKVDDILYCTLSTDRINQNDVVNLLYEIKKELFK